MLFSRLYRIVPKLVEHAVLTNTCCCIDTSNRLMIERKLTGESAEPVLWVNGDVQQ